MRLAGAPGGGFALARPVVGYGDLGVIYAFDGGEETIRLGGRGAELFALVEQHDVVR